VAMNRMWRRSSGYRGNPFKSGISMVIMKKGSVEKSLFADTLIDDPVYKKIDEAVLPYFCRYSVWSDPGALWMIRR
jgi:hypothetical protein